MGASWTRGLSLVREAAARFRLRLETDRIEDVPALCNFVATRSSFVAQKKLYGYLKARMGTRYPSMFEDDVFVESINIAKLHVFAACLSDLTVYTVARVALCEGMDRVEVTALARHCFEAGLAHNAGDLPDGETVGKWREGFVRRICDLHWQNAAATTDCFVESPKALYRWAPIADELKKHDRDIVENSIRFAFGEVTRAFRERADPEALARDWKTRPAPA